MNKLLRNSVTFLCLVQIFTGLQARKRTICYYDSGSSTRSDIVQLSTNELEAALPLCSHLIYGYAGLSSYDYKIEDLNENKNVSPYHTITAIKAKYPHLKVYLSLGGDRDPDDAHHSKYIKFLEGGMKNYKQFTQSSLAMVKRNGFDGLDLAFQFPRNKPHTTHSVLGKALKSVKKLITGDFVVDAKAATHKRQFTELIEQMHHDYLNANLALTLTVLPNVNSSWYFDILTIQDKFEYINLFAFDFVTPERNPYEADYTAPIFFKEGKNRLPYNNINFQVQHWIKNGCPAEKLNLGISLYGHAWKITKDSGSTGVPVVSAADGRADSMVLNFEEADLESWADFCIQDNATGLMQPTASSSCNARKVMDFEGKYGDYIFCPADENNEYGIWMSFDNPDFVGIKTMYAMQNGLGGMALYDINHDDFKSICTPFAYPILRAVKSRINFFEFSNSTTILKN